LPGFVPCTSLGCLKLLQAEPPRLAGLEAVVVGRSNIVGKPMAQLLLAESCTVTVTHSRTRDTFAHVRKADIVVAAVGMPGLIRGEWIKPGAAVLDVGISRIVDEETGKARLKGDVDAGVAEVAAYLSPVPGGVGPMTRALLVQNVVDAATP
jgi:methylenetetrahydrofolate dehydrogenase (NADP+)/methenyltetrahydrofolate cyclohydrolase